MLPLSNIAPTPVSHTLRQSSLGFAADKSRRVSKPPNAIHIRVGQRVPPEKEKTFLQGTPHETAMFPESMVSYALAGLMLKRFPLSEKDKAPIRGHGVSDNRVSKSLFTQLLHQAIPVDVATRLRESPKTLRKIEQRLLRQLGEKYPSTGIELEPTLVERAQSGIVEIRERDLINQIALTQELAANSPKSVNFNSLMQRHFERSNGVLLLQTSDALQRASGKVIHSDLFRDAETMPDKQGLVVVRNSAAYFPAQFERYLSTLYRKLRPGGFVYLGGQEAQLNSGTRDFPELKKVLERTGFKPVSADLCPHAISPTPPHLSTPFIYEKAV